ncbi:zeta-sarcoglycan-like [Salvelinus fontinalis]|uniref:zeta-sarcoglycan-like n=1 Tax=Salvelinus fontinalis TaxID=8038 RepID=UPI002484DC97|nr:zeta-sarcoglycan-like [Salvelinus fontinalis]
MCLFKHNGLQWNSVRLYPLHLHQARSVPVHLLCRLSIVAVAICSSDGVYCGKLFTDLYSLSLVLFLSLQDNPLILQSDRNVTVNARNDLGQLTGQLTVGSEMVEAQCQRFEVRSPDGERVLFSADEKEISIGTEKLRVTGNEGVVFGHSVETSHIRAEPFQDLKLESPTRTLSLEAPRGVEVNAGVGDFKASCRKDLLLQSSEGEIFLDSTTIRLGNIPHGTAADPLHGAPGTTYPKQTVYELCVCPSGKLYLSPAEKGSTCQTTSNVCLWS